MFVHGEWPLFHTTRVWVPGGNHPQFGKCISFPAGAQDVPATKPGIALLRRISDLVSEKPPVRDQPLRQRIEWDVHELAYRLRSRVEDARDHRFAGEDAQRGPGRGQFRTVDSLRIHPVDFEAKSRHRSPRCGPATLPRRADSLCTSRSHGSPTGPQRRCLCACTTRNEGIPLPRGRPSHLV